ncbi:MAG: hypothetical protein HY270_01490 [Deltaproteobacteria bacterium]|nr:hypothetical protein [Deltaproteobacteria bacterium]
MAKYQDLIAEENSLLALTGTAWTFGDRITQEQLLSAQHLDLPAEQAQRYLFSAIEPRFSTCVSHGDFIVAGLDFACDATHHVIPKALCTLGVAAVIARSFGAFFQRAALNAGLPALAVEETAAVKIGDRLRVDVEAHIVANLSSGDRYVIRNIDQAALQQLRAGNRTIPRR